MSVNKLKSGIVKIEGTYSIKIITSIEEFEKLQPIWNELDKTPRPYAPFLCYDWFKLWLDHFLGEDKLFILVLYQRDKAVTIAPFLIKNERFKGIRIKKLELIGNVYSPIRNFIFGSIEREERKLYSCYIINFFYKHFKDWDVADLYPLPEEDANLNILKEAFNGRRLKRIEYLCFRNVYLNEINSSEDYFNNRKKGLMKDIQYCRRRLEKTGSLKFKIITDGNSIDKYMDLYYEVYSKSWQQREGVGPTFHRDLARLEVIKDELRLGFLFYDDLPISSQFWITHNGYAYILKTVYDQQRRKFSPGKILTAHMIQYMIDIDKVKQMDYLHGDEPYKKEWLSKVRKRKGLLIFNNNAKGNYLNFLTKKILPIIQQNKYLRSIKNSLLKKPEELT